MKNFLRFLNVRIGLSIFAFLFAACSSSSHSGRTGPVIAVHQSAEARKISEATGSHWIVSTQGRAATQAVDEIFSKGGNIIDAAVAASFAISVERPQSTGIGGGGFLLYREAKTGKIYAIDFRERAPRKATERMFLDQDGEVIPKKSVTGLYSGGVPGIVKGMSEIHAKFGKLGFAETVQPAIRLAEDGFEVYPYLQNAMKEEREVLKTFPSSAAIFLKNGEPYALGDRLVQKDLANTLRLVAHTKGKDFYEGETARKIVRGNEKLGGWITAKDLRDYRVKWRSAVTGTFNGYEIASMPPPSSGGTHVIEILNIVEGLRLREDGVHSALAVHKTASAMQMAFVDRARYMGDPDFVKVPVGRLTSKEYANELRANIRPTQAYTAEAISEKIKILPESTETTHFSIMDREGNVVVSTQTINGWFGSGWVIPGTGIVLNNEMDDFSAKPGAQNIFGAVGSTANSVQPNKTPLSSMSPTIVMKDGIPILAVGAPGGTRIINCVAQTILNYLEYGLPLYESLASVRFHHQWRPDELTIEPPGIGAKNRQALEKMGYKIKDAKVGCAVMAVAREGSTLRGVSDPRDFGQALGR